MKSEEINRQAEREKAREEKRLRELKIPQEPSVYQPVSPESWRIYYQIYPHRPNFIFWWVIVASPAVALGTWAALDEGKNPWVLYCTLALCGALLLRYLIYYSVLLLHYSFFKRWRKKLPYTLVGWEHLGTQESYPKLEQWDLNLKVEILATPGSTAAQIKTLQDALYLLGVKANKRFYTADEVQIGYMGDIRHTWASKEKLSIEGSANNRVLGDVYLWLKKYPAAIQGESACIDKICLTFSGKVYEVRRVRSDD